MNPSDSEERIPDLEIENRQRLSNNVINSYNGLQILQNEFSVSSGNYAELNQQLPANNDYMSALDHGLAVKAAFDQLKFEAKKIVDHLKCSSESSMKNIENYCLDLYQRYWNELISFQSQLQQPQNTEEHLNQLIENVSRLTEFLNHISVIVRYYFVNNAELQTNLALITTYFPYKNRFAEHLKTFDNLETKIRMKFCLVYTGKPLSLVITGSPEEMSVGFFTKLAKPSSDPFTINTYLVQEDTVEKIQKDNCIPENILSAALATKNPQNFEPLQQKEESKRSRNSNPTLGTICLETTCELKRKLVNNNSKIPKLRSTSAKIPFKKLQGHVVQTINGYREENKTLYTFYRRLIIDEKPWKTNVSATAKYCLLFVLDVEINNTVHKIWTFSLPFCITSNTGQNEKVLLSILWYGVVANHPAGLLQLPEAKQAAWLKVKQVFNISSVKITGRKLLDSHLDFLREKAEIMILNKIGSITDTTEISEDQLVGSELWQYFFNCLSAVRIGTLFNDLWKLGDITGFTSHNAACRDLVNILNATPQYQRMGRLGLFIIRFSESCAGGLVFVYIGKMYDMFAIKKYDPLDILPKRSQIEYTAAVMKHLNSRDPHNGLLAFKTLYPTGKNKNEVFKWFVEFAKDKPQCQADYFRKNGYVGPH